MNTISVNGITIQTESGNVSVVNGVVKIDGKVIDLGETSKTTPIRIVGDVNNIKSNGAVYHKIKKENHVLQAVDEFFQIVLDDVI